MFVRAANVNLGDDCIMVYIIIPSLTMEKNSEIDQFIFELKNQLSKYEILFADIKSPVKHINNIKKEDVVLIFNGAGFTLDYQTDALLKKAQQIGALIYPIAWDKTSRMPAKIISTAQSFDVYEQLRHRNLKGDYITVIAQIIARKLISKVMPTIYRENGMIFVSHRRIDGEDIAAKLCDMLTTQIKGSTLFRDVASVEVGNDAQKEIDESMAKSDAFIFLHTPQSINTPWIQKELRFAVIRCIPILWIQIDDADCNSLLIKPSDNPHLSYRSVEFNNRKRLTDIVDEIMNKMFEIIMSRSNRVFDYCNTLHELLNDRITQIDHNKMVYKIDVERKGYHYPQRNISQYIQLYGCTPTIKDGENLQQIINASSNQYDSAVILTDKIVRREECSGNCIAEPYDDFIYNWSEFLGKESHKGLENEIIISGAFPACEEIYKQTLTDALVIFCKSILRAGYTLTFGLHPTFQELFFAVSNQVYPSDSKNHLKMYISKFFQGKYQISYLEEKAQVHETENKGKLVSSLKQMRTQMIQRDEVVALVCLGGLIKDDKNQEGIREEISLAIEKNIPVFIVGSVGGCSSIVAAEYKSQDWKGLNNAPKELNSDFADCIDYYSLAHRMLDYLKNEAKY